jgi:hypothetical protein
MDLEEPKRGGTAVLQPPAMPPAFPIEDAATLGLFGPRTEGGQGGHLLLPDDHPEPTPASIASLEDSDEERRKRRRLKWETERRSKHAWELQRRVAQVGADVERLTNEIVKARQELHVPLPSLSALPGFEVETLRSAAARRAADILATACKKTLQSITQHKWSWPFNTPVDTNIYKDYHEKVETPMDFGTVKRKLDSGVYTTPEAFLTDMRLVFENARSYNKPGTDVYVMATTLHEKFEEKTACTITPRLVEAVSIGEAEALAARQRHAGDSSVGGLKGSAAARCTALIRDTDAMLAAVADAKSLAASACTPLTRAEKEELAAALGRLSQASFECAMGLVLHQHPGLQPFDDVGFDLDMLDALTLRQLQSFTAAAEAADKKSADAQSEEKQSAGRVAWPGIAVGLGLKPFVVKKQRSLRGVAGTAGGGTTAAVAVADGCQGNRDVLETPAVATMAPAGSVAPVDAAKVAVVDVAANGEREADDAVDGFA